MAISVPAGGSGNLNLMTLSELIRSSALVHSKRGKYGRSMNQAVQKEFGTIYYNNKTVIYNPDTHILEIRMGMGTKTETAYKGMHSVRMAIYGVEGTIYDSLEELYMDKTGMTADSEDMNDMRKAIRGETSAQIDRRLANADKDWENATKKEANKFSLTYDDKNARLEGYIIPVAAMDSKSGAYTYEDSGRIFYMEKPIDVNAFVRVSCSCFPGDTPIIMADGTYKTLNELEGESNFKVVAYNRETDTFEIANAINCKKYKENAELLEIKLDNGQIIRCTPDHQFLLKTGEWVAAENLQPNDSLRALYAKKKDEDLYRIHVPQGCRKIRTGSHDTDYYVYIYFDPEKPGNYVYGNYTFNYEPIYVGKGINCRYKVHMAEARRAKHKNRFHARLINMDNRGVSPIITKYAIALTEDAALQLEEDLIEKIGNVYNNSGPLLNLCMGGTKLSEAGRALISERMRTNNPMFNKETAKKANKKFIKTIEKKYGSFSEYMRRIQKDHPPDYKKAAAKRKANDPNTYQKMIEGHKRYLKESIANGTFHAFTEKFRKGVSERSRKQWQDENYREYMSQKCKDWWKEVKKDPEMYAKIKEHAKRVGPMGWDAWKDKIKQNPELVKIANKKRAHTVTVKRMVGVIKEYGEFLPDKYIARGCAYGIKRMKTEGVYEQWLNDAYEKAYENHKVVSVQYIQEREDVYCITVEKLGNFVLATPDNNDIISGVVVKNCSDYFFTHSYYNYQAGAHLGMQPASYPGKNSYSETIRNMTKSPGMCKHLMMFTMLLLNGGIISKANTKGFQFNMEAIRNRTEKLNVPRKLADSGDWGNHLRELQRSLLKADQRRYSQMGQTLTDQYNKWKKAQIEHNSITFDKSMNPRKGVNKSTFASNAPMNTFGQDIQNMRAQYGDYADQIMTPRTQRVLDLFRHNI